jgi:hypothetical protein
VYYTLKISGAPEGHVDRSPDEYILLSLLQRQWHGPDRSISYPPSPLPRGALCRKDNTRVMVGDLPAIADGEI